VLQWKWWRGETTLQDFIAPTATSDYALCVYDHSFGVPRLATSLLVPAVVGWRTTRSGFEYRDVQGVVDGVKKIRLKAGDFAHGKVEVEGFGFNLPLPLAVAGDRFFDVDPFVNVQLINLQNGVCWNTGFGFFDVVRNAGTGFRAGR
jgi:hypothetical protein